MIKGCSAVGGSGELYSRECIDPNKNEAVHVSLCGGGDDDDAQLTKQEPCQNKQLPVAPSESSRLFVCWKSVFEIAALRKALAALAGG